MRKWERGGCGAYPGDGCFAAGSRQALCSYCAFDQSARQGNRRAYGDRGDPNRYSADGAPRGHVAGSIRYDVRTRSGVGGKQFLRSQLVGISAYDPVSMAGAPIALILIAVLACLVPARRALSIDPAIALRHD